MQKLEQVIKQNQSLQERFDNDELFKKVNYL